jgi:ABC-type transporter Mla subunit MlaD
MTVESLYACLWEERQALDDLVYHLEAELSLVEAGRHRRLPRATAAVQHALAELAARDRARAEAVATLAGQLGLERTCTLEALAQAIPDHTDLLREHRRVLRNLVGQVDDLTRRLRSLLARHLAATTDALALLGVPPSYPTAGSSTPATHLAPSVLVDARV